MATIQNTKKVTGGQYNASEVEIANIDVGRGGFIKCSVVETKRGELMLNMREFAVYRTGEIGPTKFGMMTSVENIDELQEMLEAAKEAIEEHYA